MRHIFRILRSARELWPVYALISVFTVVISLMTLLMPLLTGWAIDEMQRGTEARIGYAVGFAFAIFILDLLQNLFSNISGYYGDQMAARLSRLLSVRYYEHLLTLPQRFFDHELSGKLINRLNRSISQIASFMQMMSNNFLQFIFTTIFSLIVVAFISPPVALLLMSLYPIYILMTLKTSSKWQKYQQKINNNLDIATGRFAESISQLKVVKSYIKEKYELKFFSKHADRAVAITRPQSRYWHTRDVQRRVILNVIFLFVYLYIFVQGAQGTITPGQAVTLILYAMQIRIPIFTISYLVENTQRAIADSRDYFEVMAEKPLIADKPDATKLQVTKGAVRFDNVSFSYDSKQPVLQEITFNIEPGSKIALVGESGEGKTTITNLLLRLYEPEKGDISIDGHNISDVTQASLRESIAVVFQEPALFSGTIRENIAYAKPNASQKDVIAAAEAANAHEFISQFDSGYDTEIGERGLKLSGGQKQRIAIARALMKDAPLLVLDEATSSLDSKSEVLVQEALQRLMAGRTTIIIAHRFSTIQNVDTIIALSKGSVDEVGSPSKLAKSGGIYSRLLQLQRSGSKQLDKKLRKYDIAT